MPNKGWEGRLRLAARDLWTRGLKADPLQSIVQYRRRKGGQHDYHEGRPLDWFCRLSILRQGDASPRYLAYCRCAAPADTPEEEASSSRPRPTTRTFRSRC